MSSLLNTTLILIAGTGSALLLVLLLFAKRQIMRFSLSSRRSPPHVPIGHSAPRSLQLQIEQQLVHNVNMKHEPKLLGDDDYRLAFLNKDTLTGEACTYIYRMKAVDALSKLDSLLRKVECRRVRPVGGKLKEYILSLRDPPQAPLKGASVSLCRAFAAAYESAQYSLKPFGETEYNNYMTLLHELFSCIRHKGMKSKKTNQSAGKQHSSGYRPHDSTHLRQSRSQTKSSTKVKLGHQTKVDQDEASTSQIVAASSERTLLGQVTRRKQPKAKPSEETLELLEQKRISMGSDAGSDNERIPRYSTAPGSNEQTQPLIYRRLANQDSVSEERV